MRAENFVAPYETIEAAREACRGAVDTVDRLRRAMASTRASRGGSETASFKGACCAAIFESRASEAVRILRAYDEACVAIDANAAGFFSGFAAGVMDDCALLQRLWRESAP